MIFIDGRFSCEYCSHPFCIRNYYNHTADLVVRSLIKAIVVPKNHIWCHQCNHIDKVNDNIQSLIILQDLQKPCLFK